MTALVPLTPALAARVRFAPNQRRAAACACDPAWLACAIRPGLGFAALGDDRVLGCGGLIPFWPGCAGAWLWVGLDATRAHLVDAYRFIGGWFDQVQRNKAFRRLQCEVDAGFAAGRRFVRHLGFLEEGLMRAWGPEGQDFILFARVRPEGERA